MEITGQLQELVLSNCLRMGLWFDSVHIRFTGMSCLKIIDMCYRGWLSRGSKHWNTGPYAYTASPLWLSSLDNLPIILFPQTAVLLYFIWKYYHLNMHATAVNVVVIVGERQWDFLILKSNLIALVPHCFLPRRPYIWILYLCKDSFVFQAFHVFPWEVRDDL